MLINNTGKIKFNLARLNTLFEIAILVSVLILILIIAHKALFDADIWLHLKTGEVIFKDRAIPTKDIFSFTVAGRPWIDHEWLFQLISYLVYAKWGVNGLIALQSQLIILSFAFLLLIGYRHIKSFSFVSLLALLAAYASIARFNIRPDIFSLLFFSLYLYCLNFHYNKKVIYLLIPLQILWVNSHGYFFLGPLLILLFILSEFLRRNVRFLSQRQGRDFALTDFDYRRLKKLFLFTILACLINPNFLKGALYPLWIFKEIVTGRSQIFFRHIIELAPIFKVPQNLIYRVSYNALLSLSLLAMLVNFKKLRIIDTVLFLFFFLFSLRARNIAFFSFMAYAIIVYYAARLTAALPDNLRLESRPKKIIAALFKYGMKIVIIIWLIAKINQSLIDSYYYNFEKNKFETKLLGIQDDYYPKKAVDFILKNDIPGNIFHDFNSGAYLIGRAYPKRKVFTDGRTEVYGAEFFQQLKDIVDGDVSKFEAVINKYDISIILFSLTRGSLPDIIGYIYKNPQWKLVFFDEAGIVFLKDIPVNKELIKKYKIDFKNYSVAQADLDNLILTSLDPFPYIRHARLLHLLEEDGLAILELKQALRIMPSSYLAHYLLGKIYLNRNQFAEALDSFRTAALLSPNDAKAVAELGNALGKLKKNKLAVSVLKRATKFKPVYAPAYYYLGINYLTLNNESEAVKAFDKAIKYAPRNAGFHQKLAEALYEKGKKSKDLSYIMTAKEELELASKLNIQEDQGLFEEIKGKIKEIEDYLSGLK